MWCCKSNAATAAAVVVEEPLSRSNKHHHEDANSVAATNNSEDTHDSKTNMAALDRRRRHDNDYDEDGTHADFIVQTLSEIVESTRMGSLERKHYLAPAAPGPGPGPGPGPDENERHAVIDGSISSYYYRDDYDYENDEHYHDIDGDNDDDDDNITTVYSEETPLPRTTPSKRNNDLNAISILGVKSTSTTPAAAAGRKGVLEKSINAKIAELPVHAYVMLPDVPQRGYEPEGYVVYPKRSKWIRTKPYEVGTLVWYRYNSSNIKFKWYIPGTIQGHVMKGNRVEGYVIQVNCEDHILERHELGITSILKNAPPEDIILRWDETVPPCPVEGIDDTERFNHPTNHSISAFESGSATLENARKKYGKDLGFQGAQQNGVGPEMWGLTMEQIEGLCKHPMYDKKMTMYDVVNNIVKPLTAGSGMSFALHCNKESPIRARVMVSHAWQENYKQFVDALAGSKVQGPFWVCALSIYQNEDLPHVTIQKQLGPSPSTGPFATVLKQADRMVAIMTDSCDIYTRLWCVYEIFIAITLNVPVSLASYNEITSSGGGSDAMYTNVVLDSSSKEISTASAVCGNPADQRMIQKEILNQVGGFELIDDTVTWVRIKALIDDMPNARQKSRLETLRFRPIGSCTASNIVARQNAAIASAIHLWNEVKVKRNANGSQINKETSTPERTDGRKDSQGYMATFQDKIFSCGQMCNFIS